MGFGFGNGNDFGLGFLYFISKNAAAGHLTVSKYFLLQNSTIDLIYNLRSKPRILRNGDKRGESAQYPRTRKKLTKKSTRFQKIIYKTKHER